MKKIILFMAISVFCAGIAYAAYTSGTNGAVTLGATSGNTLDIRLSNNVQIDFLVSTDNLGYVAGTFHGSGTRTFATSSGDSKIYYREQTAVAIPTTAPSGTGTADFSSPWVAL